MFLRDREENDVVPKVVEAILNLPENTHIAVRHTSILLLGELCEWIESHPRSLGENPNVQYWIWIFPLLQHSNAFRHFRAGIEFPLSVFTSKRFRKCRLGCAGKYMYSLSVTYGIAFVRTSSDSLFSG